VSRLGLGASVIGGLFQPVSDDEARAVVTTALALGIRYVDTAPLYGLGASERRVGEALASRPDVPCTLSTKVGRLLRTNPTVHETLPEGHWHVPDDVKPVLDFSRDGIRRSLFESLERLSLDRVGVAYVHDPDDHLDQAIAEALPALAELRAEGLVGAIGAGMTNAAALCRIVREAEPDCVLLAARYTLLDQTALDELLPLCEREGVAVVAGGVLNSGVLADPSPGARFDYAEAPRPVLERARLAASVCAEHGVPLAAAALQLPLGHPAVVSVLTGVRSVTELQLNVRHFDLELPPALWDDLVAAGILAESTPLPSGALL
jgi:D-threo-aldose 1-dehydrogenase